MQPIVVAIMLAPVLGFTRGMHWSMMSVAAALALVVWHFEISPIYFLIAGGVAGLAWAAIRGKEVER